MKISVVISTYNSKNFLSEAIDSVLGQDAEEFECIVVNDGSTDGSNEILAAYDDPRLSVIELPVNCGAGISRNIGVRCAKGDYLAIMDADDVAFPNRLSAQAIFLDQNPEIHILGTRTVRVAETISNTIDSPRHPVEDATIKSLLLQMNGSAIIHPTTMLRTDFIKQNDLNYPEGDFNEDHMFWIRCVKAGAKFHTLEEILLYKRRHDNNLTRRSEASKERAKFPAKVEIISMYFPRLTAMEVTSLAGLLRRGAALRRNQVRDGLEAGIKAMKETQSYYGESREYLNRILRSYLAPASEALRAAPAVQ